jgi:hypothetical protein
MLRNDYTVPTRCRHRGGKVDPLGCKSCRTIRQPISPSNQILDHSIQNHPKPVSFLSTGVSSGSSLTPLNPTITHTQSPHLASIASLARFVTIDFSARNFNRTFCAWYRQRSHPSQRITDKMRACVLCDIRCGSASAHARHCQEANALRLERTVILFRSPKPGLTSRLICVQMQSLGEY